MSKFGIVSYVGRANTLAQIRGRLRTRYGPKSIDSSVEMPQEHVRSHATEKSKIEIVCFTATSGLTDYSVSLARALARSVPVRLVTANNVDPRFRKYGFEVINVFRRSRHYPIDICKFVWGTYRRQPDWVIVQGPLKFLFFDGLSVRLLRGLGLRLAISVHDLLPHYPRRWSPYFYGFYYRSFDKVVVHSSFAEGGVRRMGVKEPVLVIPHGSYDLFSLTGIGQEAARSKINDELRNKFVVLFFGHLEVRKGVLEFIRAADLLRGSSDIQFVLAGEPADSLTESDISKARHLPNMQVVDSRIAFSDVENYFSACDVVALPYLEGTTSGVLKLAVAFGKPVVASRIGDLAEQIPSSMGVLLPSGVPIASALVDAIQDVKGSYANYFRSAQAYSEEFDWNDIGLQLLDFLDCGNMTD